MFTFFACVSCLVGRASSIRRPSGSVHGRATVTATDSNFASKGEHSVTNARGRIDSTRVLSTVSTRLITFSIPLRQVARFNTNLIDVVVHRLRTNGEKNVRFDRGEKTRFTDTIRFDSSFYFLPSFSFPLDATFRFRSSIYIYCILFYYYYYCCCCYR